MRYFPIWLDLQCKPCLVVGGGAVAAQKARMLLKAGAAVSVVAMHSCADLNTLTRNKQLQFCKRAYRQSDLKNQQLVVAATDNHELNQQISRECRALNILVNCVDAPEHSDYINGAIIERDAVSIAICTAGNAPVLARVLKAQLEAFIPQALGKLAEFAGSLRARVHAKLPKVARRAFWEQVLTGSVAEAFYRGDERGALGLFNQQLALQAQSGARPQGEVYLIGAGPGDPELLTFKAQRLLQKADVVIYDRLVSEEIMNLCRREAERIYVGKSASEHTLGQAQINDLILQRALAGQKVARLKGGDPFIFGRGGEEALAVAKHQLPLQIVPAVSASIGCAAYAGIPLTHRGVANSVTLVTGHSTSGSLAHLDFASLAKPNQVVVVYMGLKNIGKICAALMAAGAPPTRPIAAIANGTTRAQQVVVGTLVDIGSQIKRAALASPVMFVIGDVVNLQQHIGWFQTLPAETLACAQ